MCTQSLHDKLSALQTLLLSLIRQSPKRMIFIALLIGLITTGTIFNETSNGLDRSCPSEMVCLDGMTVPDIGPLPIFSPAAAWNLNFGASPITLSPDTVIGEVQSIYGDTDPVSMQPIKVYEIENPYGELDVRRSFEEKEIKLGTRVIAIDQDLPDRYRPPIDLRIATITPVPPGEKEELGKIMFCDNRLSKDHLYGCATCHLPHHGFADANPKSLGFDGHLGNRNTPSLYNMAFTTPFFWDGRAVTLEEQALHPLRHPREMGMSARELVDRLGNTREIDLVDIEINRHPGNAQQMLTVGVVAACPTDEQLSSMTSDNARPDVIVLGKDLEDPDWIQWKLPPKTRGALICHVESGSPALAAGLRAGSVVQTVNGNAIRSAADLQKIVGTMFDTMDPDEPIRLQVYLQGKYYKDHFREVFGTDINVQSIAEALSAFERTIMSANSPFDNYISGRPDHQFSDEAKQGLSLFKGKARCILCHNGPNFTDGKFHNVGYPVNKQGRYELTDLGRYNITRNPRDKGAFKTPSLRGVSETWPYMHDGNIPADWPSLDRPTDKMDKGLMEAVEFFNQGGGKDNKYADPLMKPLGLSEKQKKHLVAFLKALASKPTVIENCPFNVVLSQE